MSKGLPVSLIEKQERMRQETINKVLHALNDLQSQGCRLSIRNLMEYTGLARSTFAKPHVRAILADYGYALQSGEAKAAETKNVSKHEKQMAEKKKLKATIKRLQDENSQLKAECELLRGRLLLLMQNHRLE